MPASGDERRRPQDWDELRARHGLPPLEDDRAEGEPAWRLLRAGAPLPARSPAAASMLRRRVEGRPYAFLPMEIGPPAYRDADSDELALLWSFRVRTVFPDDVRAPESAAASALPPEDLRALPVCTIDGEDAKDFDDAVSCEALPNGGVRLGVHIADVSAFVPAGSALDDEALARATSIYLPNHVVPMLPERLSNDLCSLRPRTDRLTLSVFVDFDARGHSLETRFVRTCIHSRARLTYAQVQRFFDSRRSTTRAQLVPAELHATLLGLSRWTQQQQRLRDERGSLRLQQPERVVRFDESGTPERVEEDPRYFAHALIEETALAANHAVGRYLRRAGLPALYRSHPEKDPAEIARIAEALAEHGLHVPAPERLDGRAIGELVRVARRRPNAEALVARVMGLVERAEYRAFASEDEARHFGLARRSYLHFTSPIRRYPDLVVHRLLVRALEAERDGVPAHFAPEELDELCEIAAHCSLRAWLAEQAEQSLFDLFVCEMLRPHVGERCDARVLRVSPYGVQLRLEQRGADGFVPIRSLGRRLALEGPTLRIAAGQRTLSITEGQRLSVRVVAIDFALLQVVLELA